MAVNGLYIVMYASQHPPKSSSESVEEPRKPPDAAGGGGSQLVCECGALSPIGQVIEVHGVMGIGHTQQPDRHDNIVNGGNRPPPNMWLMEK